MILCKTRQYDHFCIPVLYSMGKSRKHKWFSITCRFGYRQYGFIIHEILNSVDVNERLKIYKILSLVLPVFINSNFELLWCFVNFRSSFGETFYACALSWIRWVNLKKRKFPKIKGYEASFCSIISEVSRINFWLGVYQLLYLHFPGRRVMATLMKGQP